MSRRAIAFACFSFVRHAASPDARPVTCHRYLDRSAQPRSTIAGVSPKEAIHARGVNTMIGGLLALAAYAAWPTWESAQVPELFAKLLEAYKKSFH